MPIEEHILRRLVYVKRLYLHGVEHAGNATQTDLALSVLNFDNAIEMLFYIIIEFLGLKKKKEGFHELFNDVKMRLKEKQPHVEISKLLHENEVKDLHSARNNVQHHGLIPSQGDVQRFQALTETVITSLVREIFEIDLKEISLGWLIRDKLVQQLYKEAEDTYLSGDHIKALTLCVATFETAKNEEQNRIYGSGLTLARPSINEEEKGAAKDLLKYVDLLRDEIEIVKLRLDYKKYQKYRDSARHTSPSFRIMIAPLPNVKSEIIKTASQLLSESFREDAPEKQKKDVEFCLGFTIESILCWESVPRKTWYELISSALREG